MGSFIRFVFQVLVVLGLLVGLARLVAIRWWQIPEDDPVFTSALTPTLRPGDWVLMWRGTAPGFGSLVLCPDPEDPGRIVVGRIAGEQGDRVTIDGDHLFVNDRPMQDESACTDHVFDVEDPTTGSIVHQHCAMEALGGTTHMRGTTGGIRTPPVRTTREVGDGNVFLVSDNRAFPYDSRNYGPVERATCKESIFFRVVSKQGFFDVANRLTYIR